MTLKLELIREEKLYRLLPGAKESSRLEASGVALVDENTALVVFDNLNLVARVDLSLEPNGKNQLLPAPSLGLGFEDITIDHKHGQLFCLIEALEDFDGMLSGFVSEYNAAGIFQRCARLHTEFDNFNKGYEGLDHEWIGEREYLYALCEAGGKHNRGRVDVFLRTDGVCWEKSHEIEVPQQAKFKDYVALAFGLGRVAIVSQESARIWIAQVDMLEHKLIPDSDAVYRFPSKSYQNVEGIAWLSSDTLVAVSDRKKRQQASRAAEKDQSIHVFRIPAG